MKKNSFVKKFLLNLFKKTSKHFTRACGNLLYPPLCLHCGSLIVEDSSLLCSVCSELLELLEIREHCPYCFAQAPQEIPGGTPCQDCLQNKRRTLSKVACALLFEGPARTMVHQLKYGGQWYLGQPAGAFLTAQWVNLNWPVAHFIIPVPLAPVKFMKRGFNQAQLLAEGFSRNTQIPLSNALQRKNSGVSQANLQRKQRKALVKSYDFYVSNPEKIAGKRILLVDDVYTTGTTLEACSEALWNAGALEIYGMTLCRA